MIPKPEVYGMKKHYRNGQRNPVLILAISCLVCLLGLAGPAHAWEAYVVKVEDGNTISVSRNRENTDDTTILRFYGTDAPSLRQPYGQQAFAYLKQMMPMGTKVTVDPVGTDEKGLVMALVQVGGNSVNYQMIREGLAWVNRQTCKAMFCRRWHIQEHQAITEKRGIWSVEMTTPPWQWGK